MEIRKHYGHEVVVAQYSDNDGTPVNYSIECMNCYEVLADEEVYL